MSVNEFVLGCIHRYPKLHVAAWGPQTAGWTCLVTPFPSPKVSHVEGIS